MMDEARRTILAMAPDWLSKQSDHALESLSQLVRSSLEAAVAEEREACAALADEIETAEDWESPYQIAAAIRSRGVPPGTVERQIGKDETPTTCDSPVSHKESGTNETTETRAYITLKKRHPEVTEEQLLKIIQEAAKTVFMPPEAPYDTPVVGSVPVIPDHLG